MNAIFPRFIAISTLTILTVGCSEGELPPLAGECQSPIVNGSNDSGHPAVVALVSNGHAFCSGTLVTPTVVITAAHCTPPHISGSYTDIDVYFGSNVFQSGIEVIPVTAGWTHSGWHDQNMYDDVAALRLQYAAVTTPIPMFTGNLGNGQTLELVGFGVTTESGSDSGIKRHGDAYIDQMDNYLLVLKGQPSSTCYGDSGGTTLVDVSGTQHICGIHSRADCAGESIETRVSGYIDDINTFIGQVPEPTCDQDGQCASNCSQPDPDCPCAADGHCTAACADQSTDPDCNTGPCPADNYCDAGCVELDPDCTCAGDGLCVTACADDPDCGSTTTPCTDGDCDWIAGDYDNENIKGIISSSGCALARGSSQPSDAWWLAALGLVLGLRRRRG